MKSFSMTIDAEPVQGTAPMMEVLNPATGQPTFAVPDCTATELDQAFESAERAQQSWARDDDARREALRASAEILTDNVDSLAPILTAEQGRALRGAAEEVRLAATWFSYYADLEMAPEVIRDDDLAYVEVVRCPMGVVAAITPWNYPLLLASWKLAPALRAGNTIVVKPSPYTPASTLKMVELLNEALPAGTLNAVSGGDAVGRWMTGHPTPRKISFTGSTATGRHVAASAASDLKRVTLELGGNDAAIVLDDADIDAIARKLFWGAFTNSGQVCSAIKRVYVPKKLEADLVDALVAQADRATVGDGMDPHTVLGPINNRPQHQRVHELVNAARSDGATVATGGSPVSGDGYFFETTILTSATEGMAVVDEEQFGPVLPIIAYTDEAEAIERANSTQYGLSGSVWSSDPGRAAATARRLQAGTVWANTHLALAPYQPFGGFKWSGIGVENGPWGLASFSETQVVHCARS